ncbi:MAG: PLDc N-terminal domain-containing protein [Gammaproteobacteria bacterium]|nr:PLDc N-terminal domain-containing protein [Gammaproteobacteria bacterium]
MGIEVGGLLGLIVLALDVWAIIKIFDSGASTASRPLWTLLILLLPILGLIIWSLFGLRVGTRLASS